MNFKYFKLIVILAQFCVFKNLLKSVVLKGSVYGQNRENCFY